MLDDVARPLISPETKTSPQPEAGRTTPGQQYLLREEDALDTLVREVKAALPDPDTYLQLEYRRKGPDATSVTFKSEDTHLPDLDITVTIVQNENSCQKAYLNLHEFSKAYFNTFQPDTYE
ncbi:MAG: hypothetical protein ACLFO2_01935 [Candidatus Woesearchaeota archaeon]